MKTDKHMEVYLDAFDDFVDEVTERYGGDVIENATSEAVISLFRGFLTALPSIEKAMVKAEKSA